MPSTAGAATCGFNTGADRNFYSAPDAASCFATGTGQINNASDLPFGVGSPYVYLDKEVDGSGPFETALTLTFDAGVTSSGHYTVTPLAGFTSYVLLLQQSNSPREPDWAAFLLGPDLDGAWSITGSNGAGVFSPKTLSHAILYGVACGGAGGPSCEVGETPVPGAVFLMGSVLAGGIGGMQLMRRRRKVA